MIKRMTGLAGMLLCWALCGKAFAAFSGYPLAKEGAWCWFADPRALHYENENGTINASYVGYIDVHGNIKAVQVNFLTGERDEVLVRSAFQPDDHNNPTFLVLPDERVLIIYSRHTDEAAFYYRVSRKPGDITFLGEEKRIATGHNTTYPSPFILSDDPDHFYLCWRGVGWHPTIARFTLPDALDEVKTVWGPYQMVQSTGARPYAKYYSNGKDKIYMVYTTGHPDNEFPNWVYFNVVNLRAHRGAGGLLEVCPVLEDVEGNRLSVISEGKFKVEKTADYFQRHPATVVDAPADQRDWVWQLCTNAEGQPIAAMVRIDESKRRHEYFYARWTGAKWSLSSLETVEGPFHTSPTEYCYGGGMAIDPAHPETLYLSRPTLGASGKSVHELWKYELDEDGEVVRKEQVTRDSEKNNVRPYVLPASDGSGLRLAWMNGDYHYWMVNRSYPEGYPTAIHTDWEGLRAAALPKAKTEKDYASRRMGKTDRVTILRPKGKKFTLWLRLSLSPDAYYGTLLQGENWMYGVSHAQARPYLKSGGSIYASENVLYTSDGWARNSTGTNGDSWYVPWKTLDLVWVYDGNRLTVYRGGLLDQCVEPVSLEGREIQIGGYEGTLEHMAIYAESLGSQEVDSLMGH